MPIDLLLVRQIGQRPDGMQCYRLGGVSRRSCNAADEHCVTNDVELGADIFCQRISIQTDNCVRTARFGSAMQNPKKKMTEEEFS